MPRSNEKVAKRSWRIHPSTMKTALQPTTIDPRTQRTGSRQPSAGDSSMPASLGLSLASSLGPSGGSSAVSNSEVAVTAEILPRTQHSQGVGGGRMPGNGPYTGSLHGTVQQDPARRRGPQAQVAGVDRPR